MGSSWTLGSGPVGLWTLGYGLWTLGCELWAVGSGLWTLGVIFGVAINLVNMYVFDVP